ncbi:Sodium/glucose cotransporter [bioreactor metagenome]|uniref:Sodium/glucose cotransporter n=1 Tax=bioreactor metagenome TaxID=1076179 RepID=A0A645A0G6_9ZZZZ
MHEFPLSWLLTAFTAYTALLFFISWLTSRKSDSGSYFSGNKKSPWYIVAYGMVGTSISGVTFISVPGNVLNQNFFYMPLVLGFVVGYMVIAQILLPLYYKMNLTSIYTYLEKRFGFFTYKTGASVFMVSRILGAAVRIFVVVLVLHTFLPAGKVPFWLVAFVFMFLIFLYTFKGGVKTIIWTDVLQTTFMLLAVFLTIYSVADQMNWSFGDMATAVAGTEYSSWFNWEWSQGTNAIKQFISGIFIVIVMTGLDQDMMQKNLSCRNLREAQKNMYCYGFSFVPLNFLFMCLGILLITLAGKNGIALPPVNDDILPMFATQGYLGEGVLVLFTIGIIAAAFSNSDSALTAMTTSFCVDILRTGKDAEAIALRKRNRVHVLFSVLLVLFICFFRVVNESSVIDTIYVIASYTYGPLLGMFAFGLFTKRNTKDKYVPYIAVTAPVICYLADSMTLRVLGYKFGYEMLMINGMLTFAGLWLFSSNNNFNKTT